MKVCSVDGCERKASARGWCHKHYCRWQKHGTPLIAGVREHASRRDEVWRAVNYTGSDCLIWTGPPTSNGYGQYSLVGKNMPVHRAVLILKTGMPPTANMQACHDPKSCTSRLCVNPSHLRWGTPQENTNDKFIAGTMLRGESSPTSILTADNVRFIRTTSLKTVDLAARFGVSVAAIKDVRGRRSWKHIP